MVKKIFLSLKSSFLQGLVLTAIMAGAFLVSNAKAAIDETMPASIPQQILDDWKAQGGTAEEIKASLPAEYQAKCDGTFNSACHWRRVSRMAKYPQMQTLLFAKHHNIGDIAVGYWVNLKTGGTNTVSDANWQTKGSLCLLKFENYYSQFKEILTKTDMCVKDPCISLDGKKVCFAMSPGKGMGFLLYEMKIDDPKTVKQLTFNPSGLTVADFEPCYLPNGDIMFSSTRCFGVIDCGWQPTSNMFLMDSTGKYLRRVGYDQVHTCYPQLTGSGSVLYTRWEYNDRDVSNVMGLFAMNPDGSHQTEVYGNQTTWPMTFIHGRAVPGSPNKFFAVASGHHGEYSGEVFIADNSKASNGPEHITMISPPRKTETRDNNDNLAMGGTYRNSEYPYPLDENWYLVSYRVQNSLKAFGSISADKYMIYLKSIDGKSQELLAWGDQSLHRPVVVAPWKEIWGTNPVPIAQQADYKDSMATFTMQDVYVGEGMKGVDKKSGVAKTLRVVKINYRVMGACDNGLGQAMGTQPSGVIFAAPTICPVSFGGGSWEAKEVLGEAKIFADGSAAFKVPARIPVFFQVLDSNGCCIANMRSWSTLMPGETFSCFGCHENKFDPPVPGAIALAGAPKPLDKPLGIEDKPFDYGKMVQPIFEKNCVSCHKANHTSGFDLTGALVSNSGAKKSFTQSYNSLTKGLKTTLVAGIGVTASNKAVCITTIFSQPPQMPPYSYGSTKSGMIKALLAGTMPKGGTKLTATEIKTIACWIDLECPHAGTYDSYMSTTDASKYKSLETTAQKWYDIELKNCNELAAVQVVGVKPDVQGSVKTAAVAKRFSIGYLPAERALVLNNSSQGNLILVNLRGTVVSRFNVSDLHTKGNLTTFTLPASLGTGLYIARFEGINGIQEAKISITK